MCTGPLSVRLMDVLCSALFSFRNEKAKQLEVILQDQDYDVCVLYNFEIAARGQSKLYKYKSTEAVSVETGNVKISCPLLSGGQRQ